MKHLVQPNRWTCLPTSFAMACDCSLEKILEIIGHDGSEIAHPDLDEPYRRRSFHIQECIWAAAQLGFSITPFECYPQLAAMPGFEIPVSLRFNKHEVLSGFGVITGEGMKHRHAIAFEHGFGYDPNGTVIDLENQDVYTPETIWRFK